MTPATPITYPSFATLRAHRLAARRAATIEAPRAADAIARRAGGRLVVVGSLVEGNFHERSDLDLAGDPGVGGCAEGLERHGAGTRCGGRLKLSSEVSL
jgi:hypothetical protein